jgi:hypothetical protein
MTVCTWVEWCRREAEHEVELSNRAGTERMWVCRLHLAAARLYGYRPVGTPPPARDEVGPPAPPTTAAPGTSLLPPHRR